MTIIAGPNAATPEEQEAKMQQALKGTIIMRDLTNTLSEEPPLKSVEERVADIMPWLGEDVNEGADYEMPMLAQPPKTAEEMVAAMEPWLSENINGNSEPQDTIFDADGYRKFMNDMFNEETSQVYLSRGKNPQVAKMNIVGLIDYADVHVYIMAKSDSQNFDEDTVNALKKAYKRGADIHIALHKVGDKLPKIWEEIRPLAATFRTDVPAKMVECRREFLIGDDAWRCEILDDKNKDTQSPKWLGITETRSTMIDEVAAQYFDIEPNALTLAIKEERKKFSQAAEALHLRVKYKMGGITQVPPRYIAARRRELPAGVSEPTGTKQDKSFDDFQKFVRNGIQEGQTGLYREPADEEEVETVVDQVAHNEFRQMCSRVAERLERWDRNDKSIFYSGKFLIPTAAVASLAILGTLFGLDRCEQKPNAPVPVSKQVIPAQKDASRQNGGN